MKAFQKILAFVLSLLIGLFQPLSLFAKSSLWAERRETQSRRAKGEFHLARWAPTAFPLAPGTFSGNPSFSPPSFLSPETQIPFPLSPRVWDALSSAPGTVRGAVSGSGPLVIHFQDVHQNPDAQSHLAETLQKLVEKGAVDGVALEGVFGPVNLEGFRRFPKPEVTARVADYLLSSSQITGPVKAAMTSAREFPPLVGVDDRKLYDANVQATLASSPLREKARAWLVEERNVLSLRTGKISAELKNLDERARAYAAGRLGLVDYVESLLRGLRAETPQLSRFARAMALEKALDFSAVERERRVVLEGLGGCLTEVEIQSLLSFAAAHRAGRLGSGSFHRRVMDLCRVKGVTIPSQGPFARYVAYVIETEGIRGEALFEELRALEARLYRELAKTEVEKNWAERSQQVQAAQKLIDFEMTPGDWMDYRKRPLVGFDLSPFESFYRQAEARDNAMAAGVQRFFKERPEAQTLVLVTGGYHGPGLQKLLTEKGHAWVEFTPKVERWDSPRGAEALSVFAQRQTPLGKLFAGEKLYLTPNPLAGVSQAVIAIPGLSASTSEKIHEYLNLVAPGLAGAMTIERTDLGPNEVQLIVKKNEAVPLTVVVRLDSQGNVMEIKETERPAPSWTRGWSLLKGVSFKYFNLMKNETVEKIKPYENYGVSFYHKFIFHLIFVDRKGLSEFKKRMTFSKRPMEGVGLLSLSVLLFLIPPDLWAVGRGGMEGPWSPFSLFIGDLLAGGAFWFAATSNTSSTGNPVLRTPYQIAPWPETPRIRLQFSQQFLDDLKNKESVLPDLMSGFEELGKDFHENNLRYFNEKYYLSSKGRKGYYRLRVNKHRLFFDYDSTSNIVTFITLLSKDETTKSDQAVSEDLGNYLKKTLTDSHLVSEWGVKLGLLVKDAGEFVRELNAHLPLFPDLFLKVQDIHGNPKNESLWGKIENLGEEKALFDSLIQWTDETKGDHQELLLKLSRGWNLSNREWNSLSENIEIWLLAWNEILSEIAVAPSSSQHAERLFKSIPSRTLLYALRLSFDRWAREYVNSLKSDPELLKLGREEVYSFYEKLKTLNSLFENRELMEFVEKTDPKFIEEKFPLKAEFKEMRIGGWGEGFWRTGSRGPLPPIELEFKKLLAGSEFEVSKSISMGETHGQTGYSWNLLDLERFENDNPWISGLAILNALLKEMNAHWSIGPWVDFKIFKQGNGKNMEYGITNSPAKLVLVPVGENGALPAVLAYLSHRLELPFEIVAVENEGAEFSFFGGMENPSNRKEDWARLFTESGLGALRGKVTENKELLTRLSEKRIQLKSDDLVLFGLTEESEFRKRTKGYNASATLILSQVTFIPEVRTSHEEANQIPNQNVKQKTKWVLPVLKININESIFEQFHTYAENVLSQNAVSTLISLDAATQYLRGYLVNETPPKVVSENVPKELLGLMLGGFYKTLRGELKDLNRNRRPLSHTSNYLWGAYARLFKKQMIKNQVTKSLGDFGEYYFPHLDRYVVGVFDSRGIYRPINIISKNFLDTTKQNKDIDLYNLNPQEAVVAVGVNLNIQNTKAFNNAVVEFYSTSLLELNEENGHSLIEGFLPEEFYYPMNYMLKDLGMEIPTKRKHDDFYSYRYNHLNLEKGKSLLLLSAAPDLPLIGKGVRALLTVNVTHEYIPEWLVMIMKHQKKLGFSLRVEEIESAAGISELSDYGRFDAIVVQEAKYFPCLLGLIADGGTVLLSGFQADSEEVKGLIRGFEENMFSVDVHTHKNDVYLTVHLKNSSTEDDNKTLMDRFFSFLSLGTLLGLGFFFSPDLWAVGPVWGMFSTEGPWAFWNTILGNLLAGGMFWFGISSNGPPSPGNPILRTPYQIAPWDETPYVRLQFTQQFIDDLKNKESVLLDLMAVLEELGKDFREGNMKYFNEKYFLSAQSRKGFYRMHVSKHRLFFDYDSNSNVVTFISFPAKDETTKSDQTVAKDLEKYMKKIVMDAHLVSETGIKLGLIDKEGQAFVRQMDSYIVGFSDVFLKVLELHEKPDNERLWEKLEDLGEEKPIFETLVRWTDESKGNPQELLYKLSRGWNLSPHEWGRLFENTETWLSAWNDILSEVAATPSSGQHARRLLQAVPSPVLLQALRSSFDRWARDEVNAFRSESELLDLAKEEIVSHYRDLIGLDPRFENSDLLGYVQNIQTTDKGEIRSSETVDEKPKSFKKMGKNGWVAWVREGRSLLLSPHSVVPAWGHFDVPVFRLTETRNNLSLDWDVFGPDGAFEKEAWGVAWAVILKMVESGSHSIKSGQIPDSLRAGLELLRNPSLDESQRGKLGALQNELARLPKKVVFVPVGETGVFPAVFSQLVARLHLPYRVVAVEPEINSGSFGEAVSHSPATGPPHQFHQNGEGVVQAPGESLRELSNFLQTRGYKVPEDFLPVLAPIQSRYVRDLFEVKNSAVFILPGFESLRRDVPTPASLSPAVRKSEISLVFPDIKSKSIDLDRSLYAQLTEWIHSALETNNLPTTAWGLADSKWIVQQMLSGAGNNLKANVGGRIQRNSQGSQIELPLQAISVLVMSVSTDFVHKSKDSIRDQILGYSTWIPRKFFESKVPKASGFRFEFDNFVTVQYLIKDVLKTDKKLSQVFFEIYFEGYYYPAVSRFVFALIDGDGLVRFQNLISRKFAFPHTSPLELLDLSEAKDVVMVSIPSSLENLKRPNPLVFESLPTAQIQNFLHDIPSGLVPNEYFDIFRKNNIFPSEYGSEEVEKLRDELNLHRGDSLLMLGDFMALPLVGYGIHAVLMSKVELRNQFIKDWRTAIKPHRRLSHGEFSSMKYDRPIEIRHFQPFGKFNAIAVAEPSFLPHLVGLVSAGGTLRISGEAREDEKRIQELMDSLTLFGYAPKREDNANAVLIRVNGEGIPEATQENWSPVDLSKSLYEQLADRINRILEKNHLEKRVGEDVTARLASLFPQFDALEMSYWDKVRWSRRVFGPLLKEEGDFSERNPLLLILFETVATFFRDVQETTTRGFLNTNLPGVKLWASRLNLKEINKISRNEFMEAFRSLPPLLTVSDVFSRISRVTNLPHRSSILEDFFSSYFHKFKNEDKRMYVIGVILDGRFRPFHPASVSYPASEHDPFEDFDISLASHEEPILVVFPFTAELPFDPNSVLFLKANITSAVNFLKKWPLSHADVPSSSTSLETFKNWMNMSDNSALHQLTVRWAQAIDPLPGHSILSLKDPLSLVLPSIGMRVLYGGPSSEENNFYQMFQDQKDVLNQHEGAVFYQPVDSLQETVDLIPFGPFDRVLVTEPGQIPYVPDLIRRGGRIVFRGAAAGDPSKSERLRKTLIQQGFPLDEDLREIDGFPVIQLAPREGDVLKSEAPIRVGVGILSALGLILSPVSDVWAQGMAYGVPSAIAEGFSSFSFPGGWVVGGIIGTYLVWRLWRGAVRNNALQDARAMGDLLALSPSARLVEAVDPAGPLLNQLDPRAGRKLLEGVLSRRGDGLYGEELAQFLADRLPRGITPRVLLATWVSWWTGVTPASPSQGAVHVHFAWEKDPRDLEKALNQDRGVLGKSETEGRKPLLLVADSEGRRDVLRNWVEKSNLPVFVMETLMSPTSLDGTALQKEFSNLVSDPGVFVSVSYGNETGFVHRDQLTGFETESPLYRALMAPLSMVLQDVLRLMELAQKIAQYA